MTTMATLLYKLRLDERGDYSRAVAFGEKTADSVAAARTEVERPIVDVHAHEPIGLGSIEIAAVLERIIERLVAMRQSVLDALVKQSVHVANDCGAEIFADTVGAERQRQIGLFVPPLAEIDDELQARDRQR